MKIFEKLVKYYENFEKILSQFWENFETSGKFSEQFFWVLGVFAEIFITSYRYFP